MKKKVLIGIGIVFLLIALVIGYMIISDLRQEEKLKVELTEINDMTNFQDIDADAIYDRLNKIITKGDYAKVEKALKSYLKDNFDNMLKITEILNDENLVTILTAESYLEDGKDFINTKKYIEETKKNLEKYKQEYKNFFTEEKVMSYINDYKLDSYYTDLYKEEYVGDINSAKSDKTVENSIDEIINLLNISEQVINLLSNNPNNWEIQGDSIVFDNDSLSNEYDSLINQLS